MTTRTPIITNKNGNPPGPVSKPPSATLSSLLMKEGPRLLLLIVLVASASLAFAQFTTPAVIPANALASEFSAKRAMTELPAIAKEPLHMGSPANATVQSYLIQQITALRLTPVVQTTTVTSRQPGSNEFLTGTVHNVIVRLKGTASTRAILLDAHYDSAATAPGATDDGSAVVTALETLRALGASPPLKTMWFDEVRTKETDFATQKNILTSHMNGPTCTFLLGVTICSSTMTHLFPF